MQYIFDNKAALEKISIQKMASDLYVSPNSIMRVAKKLGYNGFSELKFLIQNEKNEVAIENDRNHIIDKLPKNIVKTLQIIDKRDIELAASKFFLSKTCFFFGLGDSIPFCEMIGKNMKCLDKKAEYFNHLHDMEYAIQHCGVDDILVFISASGETQRLCDLAQMAKQKNATMVSITHFSENTISRYCDINLFFWGEERMVNGYNVTDRSGLMILLRLLSEKFWEIYCV